MDRRDFISLVVGTIIAAPLAGEAQQPGKVYRIGFLRSGHPPESYIEGLQQGLTTIRVHTKRSGVTTP